jgi:hypothetical protein
MSNFARLEQVSIGILILSTREGLRTNHGYKTGTGLLTIRYNGVARWGRFQVLAQWNCRIAMKAPERGGLRRMDRAVTT